LEAQRRVLTLQDAARMPLAVSASGMLAAVFPTYALWAGDLRHAATALIVFGGLFATSLAVHVGRPERWLGRLVQAGFPLLFWPLLYQESVETVMLARGRYVDAVLMRFDAWLFQWPHGVPSAALLGGPIEELASLFYVSYYAALPLGFLALWRWNARLATRYTTAILTAFAACAILWLVVPAGGLHPTGGPTGEPWGPFTAIARMIYANHPHFAAAFPSSHVALAVAAAAALRCAGYGAWVYLWALGIALATVVGQYHYSLDAVAGWGVGWLAARRAWAEPG
jgi:membrane-associated phospholipid phosphatase